MEISQLVQEILVAATQRFASDLYVLPSHKGFDLKLLVLDQLFQLRELPAAEGQQLISYLKYRGNMQISDHRRPQLGAWRQTVAKLPLNIRISTVGDFLGRESLVLRLIYPRQARPLNYLNPVQRSLLLDATRQRGLMLFAGPMGSGKTSTIYDLAQEFAQQSLVLSIEDPVEIHEPAFLQLQVNAEAQMGYSELLKVALRHHPDVFIIGEIRDEATAVAAVKAALSGHLVFSTIHARHPAGVYERIHQLGISAPMLRQALNTVAYQRLIPMMNGQAGTFFDLLNVEQLFSPKQLQATATSQEWRNGLAEQVQVKQISAAVANKYQKG